MVRNLLCVLHTLRSQNVASAAAATHCLINRSMNRSQETRHELILMGGMHVCCQLFRTTCNCTKLYIHIHIQSTRVAGIFCSMRSTQHDVHTCPFRSFSINFVIFMLVVVHMVFKCLKKPRTLRPLMFELEPGCGNLDGGRCDVSRESSQWICGAVANDSKVLCGYSRASNRDPCL